MTAWMWRLMLAPIALFLPWLIPAVQQKWKISAYLGAGWLAGWLCAITLWAGPGLILILAIGLVAAWVTKVEVPR